MTRETTKCQELRELRGDFDSSLTGYGIDIGAGKDVLRVKKGRVDYWDLPQGDAQFMRGVEDETYDFVYSSHCLEHMWSVPVTLENWVRILKKGGFLYVVVPDYILYEHMTFPSMHNRDHKQTFSLVLPRTKTHRTNHWHSTDIENILGDHHTTLERAVVEDQNYDYSIGPRDQTRKGFTTAQICFLGRKNA